MLSRWVVAADRCGPWSGSSRRAARRGEVTQYLPFEVVDDALEQTRTVQRRLRELPSRTGVYFLLALGLFPRLGYSGSERS